MVSIPNDIRKRVIESHVKGHSRKQIASLFGIKYATIQSIIAVYNTENRYEKKLKGGTRKKTLLSEHVDAIREWIDEDCGITLRVLRSRLYDKFNVTVSEQTVNRYIADFNYTFKNVTLIPKKRNDDKVINERHDYAVKFMDILSKFDESHLVFVDEVGFNVSMRSKRGRSPSGTPAVHVVSGIRTRNISICCAMTRNGIVKYDSQTSAFKTSTFADFIDSLLDYMKLNIPNGVVIMDNVPFHKSHIIKEKFENNENVKLLFLPPYSPFLNPIENMFSKWKLMVRQARPGSEEHLFQLIDDSSSFITNDDCAGFYRNVFSFIPKCLNRLPIIDGN